MLSIQLVRDNPELVKENTRIRGYDPELVDKVLLLDDEWRKTKQELDLLRHKRNKISEDINKAKKDGKDITELLQQAKKLPLSIKELEEKEVDLRTNIKKILLQLPNILQPEVPLGSSEKDNVVRDEFGEKKKFDFEVVNHAQLIEELGLCDFEASRRTSGNGFFFLKGDLALLEQALQRYAIDIMVREGFTPVIPPFMIRKEVVEGVVDLTFFEEMIYKVENEDLYLIATSEHPLVGMFTNQVIQEKNLPILLCGVSACFRRELGAHGIDEKGLFRTHQFNKIEQVVICKGEDSRYWYDKLLKISKKILTELGLPWRELEMCTGDLGIIKSRQSDLEVWSPRREDYFEVGSCSNLTDAQARRLNIRYAHKDGKKEYCHTLNNTAIATSRVLVAIIENYQQKDKTITIPDVLIPYMNGKQKITNNNS